MICIKIRARVIYTTQICIHLPFMLIKMINMIVMIRIMCKNLNLLSEETTKSYKSSTIKTGLPINTIDLMRIIISNFKLIKCKIKEKSISLTKTHLGHIVITIVRILLTVIRFNLRDKIFIRIAEIQINRMYLSQTLNAKWFKGNPNKGAVDPQKGQVSSISILKTSKNTNLQLSQGKSSNKIWLIDKYWDSKGPNLSQIELGALRARSVEEQGLQV